MSSLLDVLFSMVLGGMLMVTVIGANDVALENSALLHGDRMVQETAVGVSMYLDGELRNMGFGVPDTMKIVMVSDSNKVTYRVSQQPFVKVDTISFYLGSTDELAATPNSQDRYLYRQENQGEPIAIAVLTYLRFRYYDRSDKLMSQPISNSKRGQVFKVEVTTEVQNSYALYRDRSQVEAGQQDALYSSFLWSQTRLASQNMRVAARPAQHIRKTRPPAPPTPPKPPGPVGTPKPKPNPNPNPQAQQNTVQVAKPKPAPAPPPAPRPPKPPPPPPPPPPPILGFN